MCGEIFTLLFDRFDQEMLKKKVEKTYKKHSINNSISFCLSAINISKITNDPGDNFTDYPIYDFDQYDYDEESVEPVPAKLDAHGKQSKMADREKLGHYFQTNHFNEQFQIKPTSVTSVPKNVSFAANKSKTIGMLARRGPVSPLGTVAGLLQVPRATDADSEQPSSRSGSP